MKLNGKIIGFALAGLVLLPSCVRVSTYRSRPLKVFKNSCTYTNTEKGIIVSAKQLNRAESSYIFDGRLESIGDLHIIYLSIYNLSSRDYILSSQEISLSHLSYEDLYKNMKKTSSVARLFGAAGMKTISYGLMLGAKGLLTVPNGIAILFLAPAAAILSIPPFVASLAFLGGGIKSIVMNRRIHNDLQEKILDKEVIIESGDKYEGLVFVKSSDYRSDFTVTMHEKDNPAHVITFDVNL